MKVLCCSNSFKASISAIDACKAMAEAVTAEGLDSVCVPLSDGGDGFLSAMLSAAGGQRRTATVTGPNGHPLSAAWGITPDGTAVIEMAECAGLRLPAAWPLNPLGATTRGVGELILAALNEGCRHVTVGLGGSATTDGGTGMLRALGARLLDSREAELDEGGGALVNLRRIDMSGWLLPDDVVIEAACDVDNPLIGPHGAASVFGPQKGATAKDVAQLEAGLTALAQLMPPVGGTRAAILPGGGAAGGLGAGLAAFCNVALLPGSELILNALDFDRWCLECDIILTGEGCIDDQTPRGKVIAAVSRRGAKYGRPVIALAGSVDRDAEAALQELGLTAGISIADGPMTVEYSMAQAYRLIETASSRLLRIVVAASRRG